MITFASDKITLTDGTYTFEDIFNSCTDGSVTKLGANIYQITKNIFVGEENNPAILQDTQVTINALGELLQICKGSELRLGEKRANGTTANGCTLLMPNIQLVYGFGYGYATNSSDRRTDLAGDFFAYNSIINGFGFWAFFGGEHQVVEMIDCIVDGFGRIQGENSILKNITIEKSHGRYGILSPKGTLKTYENVSCGGTNGTSPNACVYFNPQFAPQMRVVGGSFSGYEKLIYTEPNPYSEIATLEFIGSEIDGNMDRYTGDSDTAVYFKNIYNPIVKDMNGNILTNLDISIKDKNNSLVQTLTTDENGEIYIELVKYQHIGASTNPIEDMNPYTIVGTFNDGVEDVNFNIPIEVQTNMVKIPLYIGSGGSGGGDCVIDYDRIQAMITQSKDDICGCSENNSAEVALKLDQIDSSQKEMMLALGSEIEENQTIIESVDNGILIL